jgi:hypothetical protein
VAELDELAARAAAASRRAFVLGADRSTQDALARKLEALFEPLRARLVARAEELVETDLHLPQKWRQWLGQELVAAFFSRLEAKTLDVGVVWRYTTELVVPPGLAFSTRAPAPISDVRAQLDRITAALHAAEAQQVAADGRAPKGDKEYLARWASWFYRRHVCGETIPALAREYHLQEHEEKHIPCVGRDDVAVRRGIDRAQDLLALAVLG